MLLKPAGHSEGLRVISLAEWRALAERFRSSDRVVSGAQVDAGAAFCKANL